MKLLENMCLTIAAVIIFTFTIGILLEKFQYIYDGFFNTYGLIAIIIAIAILAIPYVVFYIRTWFDK